jgi:hypothetical protein
MNCWENWDMDSLYGRRVAPFAASNFPSDKFPLFSLPNDVTIQSVSPLLTQCTLEDGPKCSACARTQMRQSRAVMNSTLKLLSTSESESNTSTFELSAQHQGVAEDVTVSLQDHPAIDFLSVQRDTAHRLWKTVTSDVDALNASSDGAMRRAHFSRSQQP